MTVHVTAEASVLPARHRVLVVDHEAAIRSTRRHRLDQVGYVVNGQVDLAAWRPTSRRISCSPIFSCPTKGSGVTLVKL